MAITRLHDLHRRRFSRNLGVSLSLLAFAAVMFGLTLVKIGDAGPTEGFDHVVRPAMLPSETGQ